MRQFPFFVFSSREMMGMSRRFKSFRPTFSVTLRGDLT
ncbi:hypothetical protein HMPREF9145_2482 [Segatella salivae F0493]|uniref:Uncharacterized protein n=1 Tax=Segatella salivae F0493 TaxID=1395125 RepID=U2MQR0_9BACT|nr:hypothetical protein HMPREF9145_2482 [Segatella salivae F0493]